MARPAKPAVPQDAIGQLLLLGCHGVVTKRLEAAAAKMQIASGGGLCVHSAQHSENSGPG